MIPFFLGLAITQDFRKTTPPNITSERTLSIARDSIGYLWIGTDEGLNRFDGVQTTNYRSNIFDTTTISSNRIWEIYVDEENNVWILNDRGVDRYNQQLNNFTRFKTESRPIHLLSSGDSLLITTRQSGLFIINKKTEKTSSYYFDPLDPMSISSSRFSNTQTTPIVKYKNSLWVGTTNGLNKINLLTKTAKRFYKEKTDFVKNDTTACLFLMENKLLIGSSKGLVSYNEKTGKTKKIIDQPIYKFFPLNNSLGYIALGDKKSFLLNKETDVVKTLNHNNKKTKITRTADNQYILWSKHSEEVVLINYDKDRWVSQTGGSPAIPEQILIDPENNIWVATKQGLFIGSNIESPVKIIKHKDQLKDKLFTSNKSNHYIYNKGEIFKTTKTEIIQLKKTNNSLSPKDVGGFFVFDLNQIYFFNKSIYSLNNNKLKKLATFDDEINIINANKSFLIGSIKNSGFFVVNLLTNDVFDYRENRIIMKSLPLGASSIFLNEKQVWIGSEESGLYEYDMSNLEKPKLIKHHVYDQKDPKSFSSSSVSCFAVANEKLFIGTNGDGIFQNLGDGQFQKITFQDGLPSNNIVSITHSSDSLIWALTKEGLSLINYVNGEIKNLSVEEGIENFIESQFSLVAIDDGNAMLLTQDGHYYVDKEKIYLNEHRERVSIEKILLIDKNNKKYSTPKENIRATHKTPTINISFTSPSFYKPHETTFSYMIEGYHASWLDNEKKRDVSIQGLSPGSYTLKIKSYNSDGLESQNTPSVRFQIIPPWWKTWWAFLSYFSTALVSIVYYFNYQKQSQLRASEQKRKEEELEEARQFQLDMLPRETPQDLGLEISSTIQTASEVGGDYYDYFPQEDKKSLYVVVGDATGHGMTAGMMVSITKAGLYGIPSIPPNEIAYRLNRVIKNIDLGWNRMAFNMARFWDDDRVEFTSAAMPPVYHYHGDSGGVDEILIEGLPLGSIMDETFTLKEFVFKKGDSLVFISDGLPEAYNNKNEMLGYKAVMECVKQNGKLSSAKQKQALLDLGASWLGELQNQDDITIVVVKKN